MSHNDQRVVITGGGGFIGGALIQRLLDNNYSNITSIGRHTQSCPQNPNVKQIVGNMGDQEILNANIQEGDVVIHLGCSITPATSETNRQKDLEENLISSINLLDVCRTKKIKKLIYSSSGGTVYGNTGKSPASEESLTNPISSYGVIKLAIEKYLGVYGHLYNLEYVIVRLANPYGRITSGSKKQGAVDIFLKQAFSDEPIQISGDGEVVRDYIYIDDVIDFFIKAIEDPTLNGVYNVGTGVGHSLREIVDFIEKTSNKKLKIQFQPKKTQDVDYIVLNINRARATGWEPKYNLEDGIKKIHSELYKI